MNATFIDREALVGTAQAAAEPRVYAGRGLLTQFGVLTVFWVYVAASNVLYAHNMSLTLDPLGTYKFFATWPPRVLQHLFLYPVLLVCVRLSLRIGWRPLPRRAPAQVAMALFFALIASPLLGMSEHVVGGHGKMPPPGDHTEMSRQGPQSDLPLRIASATSFFLTYGFALALVSGLATYQRFRDSELRREALERAWVGARLAALRMQLSPHTLFNLLHTIRGQIDWDPKAAQKMIVQLGDLLRRLLAAGETEFSPLNAEIEFARLYLGLQQQRFADRLRLSLPDAITLPAAWVPTLILQPLIENAVVHGLAGHSDPVDIIIRIETDGQELRLLVANTALARGDGGNGIGLRNVRERLAVNFGERGILRVQSNEPGRWTSTVCMPLVHDVATARAVSLTATT